jgi:hypothetical protein
MVTDTDKKQKEEEGCPLESDTCGMDTTKKLSEEKNKELMQNGLDSLGDLL